MAEQTIIDAGSDVAEQAAKLIAEHGAENVVTLSGGRGLQFLVTAEKPAASKPAAKKPAAPKAAATSAAPES